MSIFYEVLKENDPLVEAALADIIAYRERARAAPCPAPAPPGGARRACSACTAGSAAAPPCSSVAEPSRADPNPVRGGRTRRATSTRRRCCTTRATTPCRRGARGAPPAVLRVSCAGRRRSAQRLSVHAVCLHAWQGTVALTGAACGRPAQVHRVAHQLWLRGQKVMARALQSRIRCLCPPAPKQRGLPLRLVSSASTGPHRAVGPGG
jgi:hypothetical protein